MDALIRRFDAVSDKDLMLCEHRGVAYQFDMSKNRVTYDKKYLQKIDSYDLEIEKRVLQKRLEWVLNHFSDKPNSVLDFGCGSGAFVEKLHGVGIPAHGFDVITEIVQKLNDSKRYSADVDKFDVLTAWDSIEHMENPDLFLKRIKPEATLFISLPIFSDLRKIRESKHYRPGEHFYYFTESGFVRWMAEHGFRMIARSEHEILCGREAIGAFSFKKDLPDYHAIVAAYKEMHRTRYYGSSAAELHLTEIGKIVGDLKPMSILDYGCGRSELAPYFWRDGKRRIERFDPAIPRFEVLPEGPFDLVFCCDVLEHVPMRYVDVVLSEIRSRSRRAIFTISTKLAKAKLPDGTNAHVCLLNRTEWLRWIWSYFGTVKEVKTEWEHELMFVAGVGG